MKIILFLVLCLFSFSSNAEMERMSPILEPLSPQEEKERQVRVFNTEVSRNLIHMAHANWNDEIVKGHTTPEFFKKYPSGKFLQYVPYGQLMSFEGVYYVDTKNGKTNVKAIAAFELQKVNVEIDYKFINDRYLIDAIIITPIQPNNQKLEDVFC